MNSELIRNLHNAMYFLNIEGHGMSADHVKEAIAALSRPVKPECVKHNYEFCKGSVAGFISHYRGERPDCPYCKVEPDKPEPLPDIQPELEGFISRNACAAGELSKYCYVISVDDFRYYIAKLTAALSAKPEVLPEVDEWLESARAVTYYVRGKSCITVDSVRAYIDELTAAHKAELEKYKALAAAVDHELVVSLESTLDSYDSPKEAINRLLAWAEQVALDPSVSRDAQALIEQGRREALQEAALLCQMSEIAASYADAILEAKEQGRQYMQTASEFIKSARAAQAEHNNGDKK